MSKLVIKQNNKSFKETFDHVEPFITYILIFYETFNHITLPSYSFDFIETFDS